VNSFPNAIERSGAATRPVLSGGARGEGLRLDARATRIAVVGVERFVQRFVGDAGASDGIAASEGGDFQLF